MVEPRVVAFLLLMAGVAVAIPFLAQRVKREAGQKVRRARSSLAERGYAVEECTNQNGRHFVRVWGILDHPVALRLRVSRRARLGLSSLRGDRRADAALQPAFQRAFRIDTNDGGRAQLILTPEIQDRLLALPSPDLRLGSLDSLLTPGYWSGAEWRGRRKLRQVFMVRLQTRLRPDTPVAELTALCAMVRGVVAKHCLPPQTPDTQDFETNSAEGQWI